MKINSLIQDEVYEALSNFFPESSPLYLPASMRGMADADIVYDFFSNKKWSVLIANLNLGSQSYALELGILFLPEEIFQYYMPLYIFASLKNKDELWVFETDFIQHYLCPDLRNLDDFINFTTNFSENQLLFIAQFMAHEALELKLPFINKAYEDFWSFYL